MRRIELGKHAIGDGCPAFLAAEIGINHNGEVELARRMIEAAADAGANGVKFQNYVTEDFVLDRSLTLRYRSGGAWVEESQYALFKRCELDAAALRALRDHAYRCGVVFHSTPTSASGIEVLRDLDVEVLKNGSDFLTHLPLIGDLGRTGLPTVLSTGMATLAEVDEAVRTFRGTGNQQLVLLLCTSAYPTPMDAVNLRRLAALRSAFGCLVGFSDHTATNTAALGAVALGACWIEKHFTLSHDLPGPDQHFSATPGEFGALVRGVRELEAALGTAAVLPTRGESESRRAFRLSCTLARARRAGEQIAADDIAFQRPGDGLPPHCVELVVGKTLRRSLDRGAQLQLADLE